jgi:hypothetical protein
MGFKRMKSDDTWEHVDVLRSVDAPDMDQTGFSN